MMDANVNKAADTVPGYPAQANTKIFSPEHFAPFFLVTALFFLWGIPNNLNDVLIRQFMESFEISRFQVGLVQSAFYLGYFCFSIPAALMMRNFGYKPDWSQAFFSMLPEPFFFGPRQRFAITASFCLLCSSSRLMGLVFEATKSMAMAMLNRWAVISSPGIFAFVGSQVRSSASKCARIGILFRPDTIIH